MDLIDLIGKGKLSLFMTLLLMEWIFANTKWKFKSSIAQFHRRHLPLDSQPATSYNNLRCPEIMINSRESILLIH